MHCRPQDRRLSVFPFQAVSDTPSLLRPSTLPATWLPQTCSSPHRRTHGAWLETVFLFSSIDSKPNGFHTFAIVSHLFLLGGKVHKTLTQVPVVAWGTSHLGCCWVAGGPGWPVPLHTHGAALEVLPQGTGLSSCLIYFSVKSAAVSMSSKRVFPLKLSPGLPAPLPSAGDSLSS